jgi:hypothetical protein
VTFRSPERKSYHFPSVDFGGAADVTFGIKVPVGGILSSERNHGQPGLVRTVLIHNVTEIFNGVTTDPGVQVGDGVDPDAYYDTGLVINSAVGSETEFPDDGAQIEIPAGRSDITVTCQVAVLTPTGIGDVTIDIDWY